MIKKLKIFLWRRFGFAQGKHTEKHTVYNYFMIGNAELRLKRKVRK